MDFFLELLERWPFPQACLAFLALNVAIFSVCVAAGVAVLAWRPGARIHASPAAPLAGELPVALAALLVNVALTWVGLALLRSGWIVLRRDLELAPRIADLALFFFAIDVLMYALHRLAHVRWIFDLLHALHHRRESTTVVTLWVLHPLEAIGFGGLWIVLLLLHDFSLDAFLAYNVLNVAFGVLGHVGVEPFPRWWVRFPLSRWITTSTFHNQHHARRTVNLGFYTTLWDRLFGTIDPAYATEFEANAARFRA